MSSPNESNLWSSILNDVENNSNFKLPSCKQVIILGDDESGKTTLVAKLQGVEGPPKHGSGLEYAYIDVRDEYRDDHTKLSVWVLSGDRGQTNLLKFCLNRELFQHTLVILTVAMTAPWGILDQLQYWASVLSDHLDTLKLDNNLYESRRQHIAKMWKMYMDELDPSTTAQIKCGSRNWRDSVNNELQNTVTLPETTLTNNLGLEIVVVVTKTDYIKVLEQEHNYLDDHLEFMQQSIRKFCLKYGAALFYTSAKEDKNCDMLHKYLTHRMYNLPFQSPAMIAEKDAVFIPAGWDNMQKVAILYENMSSCKPDDDYCDVIIPPVTRKVVIRENEIFADDEQNFLAHQQQLMLAGGGLLSPTAAFDSRLRAAGLVKLMHQSPVTPGSMQRSRSPNRPDGSKVINNANGERVLAELFNAILNRKVSPAAASPLNRSASEQGKAALRSNLAAELDRLACDSKTTNDVNGNNC